MLSICNSITFNGPNIDRVVTSIKFILLQLTIRKVSWVYSQQPHLRESFLILNGQSNASGWKSCYTRLSQIDHLIVSYKIQLNWWYLILPLKYNTNGQSLQSQSKGLILRRLTQQCTGKIFKKNSMFVKVNVRKLLWINSMESLLQKQWLHISLWWIYLNCSQLWVLLNL